MPRKEVQWPCNSIASKGSQNHVYDKPLNQKPVNFNHVSLSVSCRIFKTPKETGLASGWFADIRKNGVDGS